MCFSLDFHFIYTVFFISSLENKSLTTRYIDIMRSEGRKSVKFNLCLVSRRIKKKLNFFQTLPLPPPPAPPI
jgi:hypothetical protein